MFLALEAFLVVIFVAIALVCPQLGDHWFAAVERRFSTFAQNRALAVVLVGALGLGIRLALLPILPVPEPKVTDEFSYLLSADTFAHRRLTNPTHPMWVHFETLQENWRPTYNSMYYPGYGLFLAFGQVVIGHPFWGVWLSSGLMCAAICWALQGWMPPSWALLGGLLAMTRLATFSYWADSYWGGTVAALGGALVIGALARIRVSQRARDSVLMAIGMALLLYTRPYEGLFFCLPVVAALAWRAVQKDSPPTKIWLAHVALPAALVMVIAFVALGYYFWRVTGSPFTTPYQVNMRTYGLVYFPWEKASSGTGFIRSIYPDGPSAGWQTLALKHPLQLQTLKAAVIWLFYFGPLLTLPCLAWLFRLRRVSLHKAFATEIRLLFWICLATYFSCMLTIYTGQPHYIAPLAAVFYAITVLMMRDLYHMSPTASAGRLVARSVPLICAVLFAARVAAPLAGMTSKPTWVRTWCSQDEQNLQRANILFQLKQTPGDHLVVVRYRPDHDFILDEWVYNGADIDGSKVIWARDMGGENTELLRYFSDRRAWLVEPDYNPPKLTPYVQ
jgi:hypothetical protein